MIVTFYSYKGGVGRSMAMANIAVLLARRGLRVLMIDWDLEAPGIENYFSSFKVDTDKPGLLTMLMDATRGSVEYRNYLSEIHGESQKLSLLTSGRATDLNYSAKLERFDWPTFFKSGGGEFLESVREHWRRDFDVTLIDSRTGLSDSGGICTIQLPDIVVGMFTANHQSLYGVRDVMRLAQNARQSLAHDRPQLSIIPIASRFGNDFRESKSWLDRTSEAMSEFYRDWLPAWAKARDVAEHLKIPHVDYFGYGEKLAVVEQGVIDPQGMGFAYEKIANLLANDLRNAEEVFNLTPPEDAPKPISKRKPRAPFQGAPKQYDYDLYVSYEHSSLIEEWLRPFVERLRAYVSELQGRDIRLFLDYREISAGSHWDSQVRDALAKSRLLLAVVTPRYFQSQFAIAEWKTFEGREKQSNSMLIVPMMVMDPGSGAPSWFMTRQSFDARGMFIDRASTSSVQTERAILHLAEDISSKLSMKPVFTDTPIVSPEDISIEPPPPIAIPRF